MFFRGEGKTERFNFVKDETRSGGTAPPGPN